MAWLGCTDPPPALCELQVALKAQVEGAGFPLNDEGFQPHVTMARHCKTFPADAAIAGIEWPVESFVLVHSLPTPGGPLYRVLKHWALDP